VGLKEQYPEIIIDKNFFTNIEIEVYEEPYIIKGDLQLDQLKTAIVCLSDLEVKGNISNPFASFGMPLVVLGETTVQSLHLSGSSIYVDFKSIDIGKILTIYAYEGHISISKGKTPIFLDDSEFSSSILDKLKTEIYISKFIINPHENVKYNLGFSYFANLLPSSSWVQPNEDYDDELDEFEAESEEFDEYRLYKPSKFQTSAWAITEKVEDIDGFMNLVNSVKNKLI